MSLTTQNAQANPFARARSENLMEGTISIESDRAIAEAQGKLVIAKKFPRDEARAFDQVIAACQRYAFADAATYEYAKGKEEDGSDKFVTGPSIRLAEAIARAWGNIDFGIRELSQKDGVSEMQAYAWDLQTNVISVQNFTVKHERHTRKGSYALKDPRDIYEMTANQAGRRLRARILAIIPDDLVKAALDEIEKTIKRGDGEPLEKRAEKMLKAYASYGITAEHIEKKIGKPVGQLTVDDLAKLLRLYNSLRDGFVRASDAFDLPVTDQTPEPTGPAAALAASAKRIKKADTDAGIQKPDTVPVTIEPPAAPATPAPATQPQPAPTAPSNGKFAEF